MKEAIAKIYKEEFENKNYFDRDSKNQIVAGLVVMAKVCDDITVTAEHDQIWAYLENEDYGKISEESVIEIFRLNWFWDDENEGFSKFC